MCTGKREVVNHIHLTSDSWRLTSSSFRKTPKCFERENLCASMIVYYQSIHSRCNEVSMVMALWAAPSLRNDNTSSASSLASPLAINEVTETWRAKLLSATKSLEINRKCSKIRFKVGSCRFSTASAANLSRSGIRRWVLWLFWTNFVMAGTPACAPFSLTCTPSAGSGSGMQSYACTERGVA